MAVFNRALYLQPACWKGLAVGAGLLGILAVLTGITLFQPHRIAKGPRAQFALRGLGVGLAVLTVWALWTSLRHALLS